ncbi:MAG: Na+/H+ antiporter subunit B [Anaerolineae bacterium]|nr:Na+/H+ antiporter subunit B [Anaerolineae bacterium]
MDSLIVRTATKTILPLLLMFAIFLFLRGHNEPGGGFIGGLVAAAAIILLAVSGGVRHAETVTTRQTAQRMMAVGLLLAWLTAVGPILWGKPLLYGYWPPGWEILGIGKLGTPLLFDLGVFFVVIGMTLLVVLQLVDRVEKR